MESKWQTKHFAFTFNRQDEWGEQAFLASAPEIAENLRKICKHFIFQCERGEQGRMHYQGYIELITKKRLGTVIHDMQAWMPGVHLSIASTAGRQALQSYCMKDETRVEGPWTDAGRPSEEASRLQAEPFDGRVEFSLIEDGATRRPFQEWLTRYILQPPDRRQIIWVGDPIGNSGKSEWADWAEWKYGAETVSYGSAKDVMSLIMTRPASKCYIFCLPRSRPKDVHLSDLYNVLEMVKDGKLINTKYQCEKKRIARPHVLVLANYFPDEQERKHLSADRWHFLVIDHRDFSLHVGTVPPSPPPSPEVVLESDEILDLPAIAEGEPVEQGELGVLEL